MKLASLFVAAAMTIPAAFSAPVTGTLNFTGNAQIGNNTINFQCDLLGVCDAGNGDFFITGGSANTGTFQTISILNRFGQVVDIVSPPLDTPFLLPNFATFVANPDVTLDVTTVFMGTGTTCPPTLSQSCTPPGSPLNILQTPTGSIATFSVLANARRISTGETSPYQGLFTLQFTEAPTVVLASLSSGASISTSYSATFSPFITSVPEPRTYAMLGAGLMLILAVRKKRTV